MIYNGISFPLTLVFKYNFVKVLLLMTFISISISLKLQIFLKINHRCLKEVIAQLLHIIIFIIMNLKFKLNSVVKLNTRSTPSPPPIIMHKHFRDPLPPPSVIMYYVNVPLVVLLSDNFIIT